MKKTTQKDIINLVNLLIILIAILLPAFYVFGLDIQQWNIESRIVSLLFMLVVFGFTTSSLQKISLFSNIFKFHHILFTFLFYFSITISLLVIFRFNYSVYYITYASIIYLVSSFIFVYIRDNFSSINIAYFALSEESKSELLNLSSKNNIVLEELKSPVDFDIKKFNLVTTDFNSHLTKEWMTFLADSALRNIPTYSYNQLFEMLSGRTKIKYLYENNFGAVGYPHKYQIIKYILECLLIISSLPITLPIMLITAIVIKLESEGGVFFVQKRVGQGGKLFKVYKFRSMCKNSEAQGSQFAQEGDMRITRVGKFIRKTRIDELPQFFNVLKGDMSLIGPRPEQEKFVNEFKLEIPFYSYRHIVKPGISGWAQVMQGYAFDVESTREKLEYDLYYIKNYSFSMDLLICFKTIHTMLTGFGAR